MMQQFSTSILPSFYQGPRNQKFMECITKVLKRGKLSDKYINLLLDSQGLDIYDQVFTHSSVNPVRNYEFYEILGDTTINKSTIWYLQNRFPKLRQPRGVSVLTRLKLNLVGKKYLADFGERLGFWEFISISEEKRQTQLKKTLEDVFEAFMGATEFMLDSRVYPFCGYSICYNIVASILDENDISIKHKDLYDAKTRLKEIVDKYKDQIKNLIYQSDMTKTDKGFNWFKVNVLVNMNNRQIVLGQGEGAKKAAAEQIAAENSIKTLERYGIKPVYDDYEKEFL